MTTNSVPEATEAALEVLRRLGEEAEEALPMLKDIALTAEPTFRIKAAVALPEIGADEETLRHVFRELLNHPDPEVRADTIRGLTTLTMENRKLQTMLVERLGDEEREVRAAALVALERIEGDVDDVGEGVVECLFDEELSDQAARTLAVVGADGQAAEKAVPRLREMLEKTRPREQYPMLLALWRLDSEETDYRRFSELLRNRKGKGAMLYLLKRVGPPAEPFAPVLEEIQSEATDPRLDRQIEEVLSEIQPDS